MWGLTSDLASPNATLVRQGLGLLTRVGSTVHGVGVAGQDDEDRMGICVEPTSHVLGLERFEHYEHRTQPQGVRSGPGDVDLVVYSLRKWMRLAIQGNPSILIPLFVPFTDVLHITPLGRQLRKDPGLVLSRNVGARCLGYVRSQRGKLVGYPGKQRPELVERYGFDTKFAYHMVRLGLQGVELLTTGWLTLPTPEPDRTWLRELRVGEHTQADALERSDELEAQLRELLSSTRGALPVKPQLDRVNQFLVDAHYRHWWGEKRDR